jgi:hypothetical protein
MTTHDFSWTVVKQNRPPTDGNVLPQTMIHRSNDTPSAPALGTKGAIFKRLDPEMKFPIPESKLKIGNQYVFQPEQFSDKLAYRHRFPLLPSWVCGEHMNVGKESMTFNSNMFPCKQGQFSLPLFARAKTQISSNFT